MKKTFLAFALVFCCALVPGVAGCGTEAAETTGTQSECDSSDGTAPAASGGSFEEIWVASAAAVEALGPVRVTMVQTTQGHPMEDGTALQGAAFGPSVTEAEQLLDAPAERARLVVRGSDGRVTTTVVTGTERVTVISNGSSTYSRQVSLELPAGLPLPLWAGNFVAPSEGYADLLDTEESDSVGTVTNGRVEQLQDGGRRLSWGGSSEAGTREISVLLDEALLPVRIEGRRQGELEGVMMEVSITIEYRYEMISSFADSEFELALPEDALLEGSSYELSLERPWSELAGWGQYWLGTQVDDYRLTFAQLALEESAGQGGEPPDERVTLVYTRPAAESGNESIQVTVRPLSARQVEDSRARMEEQAASGSWDWARQAITVSGESATAYSGMAAGSVDPAHTVKEVYVFLPDAFVEIQVLAPVDPQVVLEALQRVE
jgi:hypothetical protein